MTPSGVPIIFIFILLILPHATFADVCSNYVDGNSDVVIPEGVVCDWSDLGSIGTLEVRGTIRSLTAETVQITATSVDIQAGGKISVDAVASGGTGKGNSIGSGGIEQLFHFPFHPILSFLFAKRLITHLRFY